jgi:glycerol-3-phosphate dehydrogenase
MIGRVFPDVEVNRSQIVFQFSGVRPLAYSNARSAGQIARDHSIQVVAGVWTGLAFPVYSLVGGKWTSYRAFSAEAAEKTLEFLGLKRQKDTLSLGIGGGRAYPSTPGERKRSIEGLCAWTGMSMGRMQMLFDRYGTRAQQVCSFISRESDEPLRSLPEFTRREIVFLAQNEKIIHLDDLVLRRSMLAMLGQLTRERLDELALVLGDALGWDESRKEAEAARTIVLLADRHGVRF